MKIILILCFISLNVFSLDLKEYNLKVYDFMELKETENKIECKTIENRIGKDCVLKLKFKAKKNSNLKEALFILKLTSQDNLYFSHFKEKKGQILKDSFDVDIYIDMINMDDKMELFIDYLNILIDGKVIEKGEKKYFDKFPKWHEKI